ncbi:MAG: hypothetical protein M5U34_20940 [Chloroflexi bacterium]|nr:hypothetical protein [Chloroflexota bacterium]
MPTTLGGLITSDSFWLQKERAEALTAFAQAELALNGQQLVQGLPMLHQSGMTIGSWLRGLSASRLSPREMEAAWHNFVYNHSAAARQTLPAPLPEQDIGLLCYLDGEERIAFLSLRSGAGDPSVGTAPQPGSERDGGAAR